MRSEIRLYKIMAQISVRSSGGREELMYAVKWMRVGADAEDLVYVTEKNGKMLSVLAGVVLDAS